VAVVHCIDIIKFFVLLVTSEFKFSLMKFYLHLSIVDRPYCVARCDHQWSVSVGSPDPRKEGVILCGVFWPIVKYAAAY